MKLGFIKTNFPDEKRISLLPSDIDQFENELIIEKDFGIELGINDEEYIEAGCRIKSREEIFAECDAIVALKTIQPSDYHLVREGQMIIGWIHPEVSGSDFWQSQGVTKKLIGVDLDNITPRVYYQNEYISIPWIRRDFINRNSFNAGMASTTHGLLSHGLFLNDSHKVAILGSGNVSQGAMHFASKFTSNVRMFYRKTLSEFIDNIEDYDIVINGIQIESGTDHIVTLEDQARMKDGVLIIDAAADGDGCIEGIDYTNLENPYIYKNGKYYYCVSNSPTLYYRSTSADISKSFSEYVYKPDVSKLYELAKELM